MHGHLLTGTWCSFILIENREWPARCEKCIEKGWSCSKPTMVSLRRNDKRPLETSSGESHEPPRPSPQPRHIDLKPLVATNHGFALPEVTTSSAAEERDFRCKEALV